MPLQDFQLGDVIVSTDEGDPEHSLMWVGTDKPIVHSAEGDRLNGVVQQSASCFQKLGKYDITDTEVWRSTDGNLARNAADYARTWATRSDDQRVVQSQGGSVDLRTPYSQKRLGEASHKPNAPMSIYAIWRAVRASARGNAGKELSPQTGVSCAMFVTYCYQAASLEAQLGLLDVEWETLRQLKNSGGLMALSSHNRYNLIAAALDPIDVGCIPQAFLVDAKRTNVDRLHESLQADVSFNHVGSLVTNKDKGATHAFLLPMAEGGRDWNDVRREMRDVRGVAADVVDD